ncbi:unnamed protein product [Rhizoctonia solani]|uniref:Transmembrane protein n=1 Tax=Rhizoctonia solani TaxID=456999 RepID=A0A8H2WZH1_9AGAM|nr:unnamed protein product [Rhizoctonia solani]
MFVTRLTSLLLFALSLGFLVCAAPSPKIPGHRLKAMSARAEGGRIAPLSILEGSLRKQLDAGMRVKTIDEATKLFCDIKTSIQTASDSVAQIGKLELDEHGKIDVAVRCASILSILTKIILKICQTLGSEAVATLCTDIRDVLQVLLVNIGNCVEGIYPLVVKKLADVKAEAILKQYFVESAKLLCLGD